MLWLLQLAATTAATATVASLHLLPRPAIPTTHSLINNKPENSVPVQGLARNFHVSDVKVDVAGSRPPLNGHSAGD